MYKTISRTISLIMALALTLGTFSTGYAKSTSAELLTHKIAQLNVSASLPPVVPEADGRVREASPNANYGADTALNVDGDVGANVESYIRFTVTGISGTVSNAQLRLYVTDGTYNGPALY